MAATLAIMHAALGAEVAIRLVYIAEAHASDEWPVGPKIQQAQPRTTLARCAVAARRLSELGLSSVPALVDTSGDAFSQRYSCWPLRWYFVRDGRLEHVAQPRGGGGYDTQELVTWLFARRHEALELASSSYLME